MFDVAPSPVSHAKQFAVQHLCELVLLTILSIYIDKSQYIQSIAHFPNTFPNHLTTQSNGNINTPAK